MGENPNGAKAVFHLSTKPVDKFVEKVSQICKKGLWAGPLCGSAQKMRKVLII
jgi:hypothetical protein